MSVRHGYWYVSCGAFDLTVYANDNGAFVELDEDGNTTTRRVVNFDAPSIIEAAAILAENSEYPSMAYSNVQDLEFDIARGEFWRNFS